MNSILSLLALPFLPLLWLKRLLSQQVRLQFRGRRLRIVLQDPKAPAPAAAPAASRARAAAAPVNARTPQPSPAADDPPDPMLAELRELLTQHGGTRQLMRYLAYLERTLKLFGAEALNDLPLDVLRKSLSQLEELVTDWSSPGLVQLRLQLTMLVAEKEDESVDGDPPVSEPSAPEAAERALAALRLPGSGTKPPATRSS